MASLTIHEDCYIWKGAFEERTYPREAGFRWDDAKNVWWTKDPFIALRLGIPCLELQPFIDQMKKSWAIKPSYLQQEGLYPYQTAGVEVISEQFGNGRKGLLLADEPGLGKTVQAARIADLMEWGRLLILCPASLRLNWVRELNAWRKFGAENLAVLDSKNTPKKGASIVISYDIFVRSQWADIISSYPFDALICDESHYLKNIGAKRTQFVLGKEGLRTRIDKVLLLSATPIPNRACEIFKLCKLFASSAFPWKFDDFVTRYHRYVDEKGNPQGSRNEDDLFLRLRGSGFMVRRRKEAVLPDLPAKRHQLVVFPADGTTHKILQKERQFSAQEIIKHGVPVGSPLPKIRREMGVAKTPVCIQYIASLLDGGENKIIVGAYHTEVIAGLYEGLKEYGAVVIEGETPPRVRQEYVDAFQKDNQVRVFIGQLTAAGTGITLTAASTVVFVEASWVPSDNEQFSDRCHRIGQFGSVLVHYLVVEGSLDARILSVAANKAEDIDKIMNGRGFDLTRIDHLAALFALSPAQAIAASRMLAKYRRQL